MHLWATDFSSLYHRTPLAFPTFLRSFTPVIMSNANELGLSPCWGGGGGGGIYLNLLCPNTRIFFFFFCYAIVSLNFKRCPISELTTHSLRMVNNHHHEHTPDSKRCPRAYEMRRCQFMSYHVTCIMRATCNITKSWIIIFSTYNSHTSCISCQFIT